MSVRVMSWVFEHSRSKKNARLVLLAIADCANDEGGNAFPSNAKLMHKTGLSERAVTGLVAELEKLGELEVRRNAGPKGCNLYRVVMYGTPPQILHPADPAPPPQNLRDSSSGIVQQDQVSTPAESAPRSSRTPQETTPPPAESAPVPPQNLHPEPSFEPSLEPSGKTSSSSPKAPKAEVEPVRLDVEKICNHLADRIAADGTKRPTVTAKWRTEARLLLDRDGKTVEQVMRCIDWCQADPFWRANILSMPKLRKQYETLRRHAQRPNGRASPRLQLVEHNGMQLKPETLADIERTKRFEVIDRQEQLAIGGAA